MPITVSDDASAAIRSGMFTLRARATVTRGGEVLADNVPIAGGGEEFDASLRVPERVAITVPRWSDGIDWTPGDGATSPLAAMGQRLHVQLGVGVGTDGLEWFDRGEFLIYSAVATGDVVEVEAVGLLTLIDEARFVSPFQPSGTITSTLRSMLEPAVTLVADSTLTDRAVPTADINFDEDRLGAVLAIIDAWPAVAQITPDGYLQMSPPDTYGTAYTVFRQNAAGTPTDRATVIRRVGGSTRDGVHNVVVARGTAADGGQVQGVAYDVGSGAGAYGGPFNPLPVPRFFESPLIATPGQASAAAETILTRERRQTTARYDVEIVPTPVLLGGDLVKVCDNGVNLVGPYAVIEAMKLPYVADGGSMTLTLREVTP